MSLKGLKPYYLKSPIGEKATRKTHTTDVERLVINAGSNSGLFEYSHVLLESSFYSIKLNENSFHEADNDSSLDSSVVAYFPMQTI